MGISILCSCSNHCREIEEYHGSIHCDESLGNIGFVAEAFRQSGMEGNEEERLRSVRIIRQCGECERGAHTARRLALVLFSIENNSKQLR